MRVLPLADAHDLPAIVAGVHARASVSPQGAPWTPETLAFYLAELDH